MAVVVFLPISFGSEDGSLESPGFDQGNLWSLKFHMEEGGAFKVVFPYGKLTRLGVGISIMAHQGPTHPSFPLGNLDSLNQSSLKGHNPALSFQLEGGLLPKALRGPFSHPVRVGGFPIRVQACGQT